MKSGLVKNTTAGVLLLVFGTLCFGTGFISFYTFGGMPPVYLIRNLIVFVGMVLAAIGMFLKGGVLRGVGLLVVATGLFFNMVLGALTTCQPSCCFCWWCWRP